MKRKTVLNFDVHAAIAAAWAFLWADNLKQRAKGKNQYRYSEWFYLTAYDVENQVRQFGYDTQQGNPWGTSGRAYGRPCLLIRFSGRLNNVVRKWLLNEVSEGRLASHNFGRGHISGMRFRPAGEPISDIELNTMKQKEARKGRPRPRHYNKHGSGGRPLCTQSRARAMWRRSNAWCTSKKEEVTCPRCLNILKAAGNSVPKLGALEEAGPDRSFT